MDASSSRTPTAASPESLLHDALGSAHSLPRVPDMASRTLNASATATDVAGAPPALVARLEPTMSRASALASILAIAQSRSVARDTVIKKGATPTTATEPPSSVFMNGLVRHQTAHTLPLELLLYDVKNGLVSHSLDKSALFPPGRPTLGVYHNGERRAPVPDTVLRDMAACLQDEHISAHLPVAGTEEGKSADADLSDFAFGALVNGVPAVAATTAATVAMPEGLLRVAAYATYDLLTAHLDGLDRPALEALAGLNWGYHAQSDTTDLDDEDVRSLLTGIVADSRTVHMSLLAAAQSAPVPPAAAASSRATATTTSHDGGEDVTLHIEESRRRVPDAPWVSAKYEPLTLASLAAPGISAVRAVFAQDIALGRATADAVDDFRRRFPSHPMASELASAVKGSNDDRFARAVDRYAPGAFDKAFKAVPIGLLSTWAVLFCFTASAGGDRADLLSKISGIRISTNWNISSLDAAAIVISDVRTACTDLGLDALTDKEIATAVCDAIDSSPPAWQSTPDAASLVAARNNLDELVDDGETPSDEAYKAIVDAVYTCRKQAVRARSRVPAAPPAGADAPVLSIAGGAGGGGATDGARSRGRGRGRGRGRERERERDGDGADRERETDRGRDTGRGRDADRGRGADGERGRAGAGASERPAIPGGRRCISFHLGTKGCLTRQRGRVCRFTHGDVTKNMPAEALADMLKSLQSYRDGFPIHTAAVRQYGLHRDMFNRTMLDSNPDLPAADAVNLIDLDTAPDDTTGDDAGAAAADDNVSAPSLRSLLEPADGRVFLVTDADDVGLPCPSRPGDHDDLRFMDSDGCASDGMPDLYPDEPVDDALHYEESLVNQVVDVTNGAVDHETAQLLLEEVGFDDAVTGALAMTHGAAPDATSGESPHGDLRLFDFSDGYASDHDDLRFFDSDGYASDGEFDLYGSEPDDTTCAPPVADDPLDVGRSPDLHTSDFRRPVGN